MTLTGYPMMCEHPVSSTDDEMTVPTVAGRQVTPGMRP
jgi:hypothetical protein